MRERLRRIPFVKIIVVLGVLLALASIIATAYKFGTDRRQDDDIQDVRSGLDREARNRISAVEQQQAVDQRQDKLQNAEIARNRKLLLAILKLRDKNPELFEGITLPTTEGYIASIRPMTPSTSKPRTPTTVTPRPTRPRPKPEVTQPTPTKPAPATSTPAPTPSTPDPTPTTPKPETPGPTPVTPTPPVSVPPPVTPIPPIVTIPPQPGQPIITLPPILGPIVGPLIPPILGPVVG